MASVPDGAPRRFAEETLMVYHHRVTYARQSITPPVYFAASFTDPPWHPQQMLYKEVKSKPINGAGGEAASEFLFFQDCEVPEGQWQYKFRVGEGDWWVLDETSPIGNFFFYFPWRSLDPTTAHNQV